MPLNTSIASVLTAVVSPLRGPSVFRVRESESRNVKFRGLHYRGFLERCSYCSLVLQLHKKEAEIPKMSKPQSSVCRCQALVPPELGSAGQCVTHFLSSVEETCAQMHREIVLRGGDAERREAIASYIRECAQLLARVGSNLRLSDELKRRVLCGFLCLMNLREKLDRVRSFSLVSQRSSDSPTAAKSAVAAR